MKIFFSKVSRIPFNVPVYRNEYNNTTKIMHRQFTCQKCVQNNLMLLCLKKLSWKFFGILVAFVNGKNDPQPQASLVCFIAITNYVNTWTFRRQVLDRFKNSTCKFVESLEVVIAAWEFTIAEKSRISASFLRVHVIEGVRLKIFIITAICYFS